MKQLHLSVILELPTNLFEAAEATTKIGEPWEALLSALKATNAKYVTKEETLDARAPVERARRGRKPNGTKAPAIQHTTTAAPDF